MRALSLSLLTIFFTTNALAAMPTVKLNDVSEPSLLIRTDDPNIFRVAPMLRTEVQVVVTGLIARTTVTQEFRNAGSAYINAVYAFPLPEKAAVDTLRMRIGNRIIEGEIKEKTEAKRIFEEAKAQGKKAALVEQLRPNLFTNSVANVGPGEVVLVTIEYQQTLRYEQGQVSFRFPLAITPRYNPDKGAAELPSGHRVDNATTISVALDAGFPLASIGSASHAIDIIRHADFAEVSLQAKQVLPNKDFRLRWTPTPFTSPSVRAYRETQGGTDYAMVMLMPPTDNGTRVSVPKSQTFIVDVSGSMAGASMEQAKAALERAVMRLTPVDRLQIIEFDSTASALWRTPREASRENIREAVRYIRALHTKGGTEMRAALELAFSQPASMRHREDILFITDGAVSNEAELFRLVEDKLGGRRLFTIGIGGAPNAFFMTKAAQFGKGTYTFIASTNDVEEEMGRLFAKLDAPALTDIELVYSGENVEVFPAHLPDLFVGEPLVVMLRGKNLGGAFVARGIRDGKPVDLRAQLSAAKTGSGVATLWAREKIDSLTDLEIQGQPQKQAIIDVALHHHLVSQYTSLVAVEKTPAKPRSAKDTTLQSALPDGYLPQGGTAQNLLLLIGALLMAAAAMLFRRSPA